jgi:YggT family protein
VALPVILGVANAALILYLFLLSARIVLSWFSGAWLGRPWEVLCRVTDPYLGLFYRLRFLRRGVFDFTPVVAVLALVVVLDLVNELIMGGRISLGIVLAAILAAAWSGARFLILLFLVIGVLRTVPFVLRATARAPLWKAVDVILEPVVGAVSRAFHLADRATPAQRLILTLGLLLVAWLLGELAVRQLVHLLQLLPV